MSPKEKIFCLLDEADDVLSGERISAELGISRVSVWKHIKGMVQSGISISSSPRGYRLNADPDSLVACQFGERSKQIHYFQNVPSTMDQAIDFTRKGCPDNTVVVAQRQTQGRGRMSRSWLSADGGLYFTIVVRPDVQLMQAGLVNLAAAIDMTNLLRSLYTIDALMKWPNDILVGERKLCGILSHMEIEGGQVSHISVGVGLNVNNAMTKEAPLAVSLKKLIGRPVPRREILIGFLERFEKRMERFDPAAVVREWKAGNATIGRLVRVETVNDTHEGIAEDIDSHGSLMLRQPDGNLLTVNHGDCFHQQLK